MEDPVLNELEVDRDRVTILEQVGSGQFGVVSKASASHLPRSAQSDFVAVKSLRDDSDVHLTRLFGKEASRMCELDHANVLKLLAVCLTTAPNFIVLEYADNGDLKSYLRSCNEHHCGMLRSTHLVKIASDASSGLAYLASRRFVHRDLAARNILLDSEFTAKIGDFGLANHHKHRLLLTRVGMSRHLYVSDVST